MYFDSSLYLRPVKGDSTGVAIANFSPLIDGSPAFSDSGIGSGQGPILAQFEHVVFVSRIPKKVKKTLSYFKFVACATLVTLKVKWVIIKL